MTMLPYKVMHVTNHVAVGLTYMYMINKNILDYNKMAEPTINVEELLTLLRTNKLVLHILTVGKTGAGKSSLLNAILDEGAFWRRTRYFRVY